MECRQRAAAKVIDFAAYRAGRRQPSLLDDPEPPGGPYQSVLRDPAPPSLSDRQVAHRRRMLAFLLTPR